MLKWNYDSAAATYESSTKDGVVHRISFVEYSNNGWRLYCSNSHKTVVPVEPEEPDIYKSLCQAQQSCNDFEDRKKEKLEMYEFELDRKTDD